MQITNLKHFFINSSRNMKFMQLMHLLMRLWTLHSSTSLSLFGIISFLYLIIIELERINKYLLVLFHRLWYCFWLAKCYVPRRLSERRRIFLWELHEYLWRLWNYWERHQNSKHSKPNIYIYMPANLELRAHKLNVLGLAGPN